MKKTLLSAAVLAAFLAGCRGWPAAHDDVVKIQSSFKVLRTYTQARSATDTATVTAIEDNIDASLADMADLTK